MKEYRLVAWPQLRPPFDRTSHRRMLSEMSQRYLTLSQLVASTGMRRPQVRAFLEVLQAKGLIAEREIKLRPSMLSSLRPIGGWLRRALTPTPLDR